MKTETALVPITRYRDEDGNPVCGDCKNKPCYRDEHRRNDCVVIPGPTCPIWKDGISVVGDGAK